MSVLVFRYLIIGMIIGFASLLRSDTQGRISKDVINYLPTMSLSRSSKVCILFRVNFA